MTKESILSGKEISPFLTFRQRQVTIIDDSILVLGILVKSPTEMYFRTNGQFHFIAHFTEGTYYFEEPINKIGAVFTNIIFTVPITGIFAYVVDQKEKEKYMNEERTFICMGKEWELKEGKIHPIVKCKL
jgi:hypothetical protein